MKKEALLVCDMLNDFVLAGAPLEVPDARAVIPVIRTEIDKAHAVGNPVVYICDAHEPDDKEFRKFGWPAHAVRGTQGAKVINELAPTKEDVMVYKKTYSGFYGTVLDATLRRLSVDSLRITGLVTHICVLFTTEEAVLRDYKVVVVENGVAGLAREDHEAALRIMKNVFGVRMIKTNQEKRGLKAA